MNALSCEQFMNYTYDGEEALEGFKDRVKLELKRFVMAVIVALAKVINQFNRLRKISIPKSMYNGFAKLKTGLMELVDGKYNNRNSSGDIADRLYDIENSPEYDAVFNVIDDRTQPFMTVESSKWVSESNKLMTKAKKLAYSLGKVNIRNDDKSRKDELMVEDEIERDILNYQVRAISILAKAYDKIIAVSVHFKKKYGNKSDE